MSIPLLQVEGLQVELTNLQKIFWSELNLTKGDLLQYYIEISPYLLKYVQNRIVTMVPYPHGIEGPFFYQKRLPKERPSWLSTTEENEEEGPLPIIEKLPDLLWLVNRGCIEVHTWFSSLDTLAYPDYAVFDLDPMPDVCFSQVLEVALVIREILEKLNLKGYPKTSGKRGLHIYLPLKKIYTYPQIRKALKTLCQIVTDLLPEKATIEWSLSKRRGVYLDYRQNGEGKTLAAPYSLRPTKEATISTPISWSLVERGGFYPQDFTIESILPHLMSRGDTFTPLLEKAQSLPSEIL